MKLVGIQPGVNPCPGNPDNDFRKLRKAYIRKPLIMKRWRDHFLYLLCALILFPVLGEGLGVGLAALSAALWRPWELNESTLLSAGAYATAAGVFFGPFAALAVYKTSLWMLFRYTIGAALLFAAPLAVLPTGIIPSLAWMGGCFGFWIGFAVMMHKVAIRDSISASRNHPDENMH